MGTTPRILEQMAFEEAAQAYLRSLPPEHFMESVAQATQRKITVASMELVHLERPDVQTFSELLVQYRLPGKREIRGVVPDNMVVHHDEPIEANGSFDVPLQACGPFCVMEYVSKSNRRKDYEDSLQKYERELKVPYYLLFVPDVQELTLYRHGGRKYKAVPPDEHERHAIPELELEVGLLDGWVRFWFRGRLLPLPADLQRTLEATLVELKKQRRRATILAKRVAAEAHRADQLANRAGELANQNSELAHRNDELAHRADELAHRADELAHRADELNRLAAEERQARLAAEQELTQLRAQLEKTRPRHAT